MTDTAPPSRPWPAAVRATLRFAHTSGAWIVPGQASAPQAEVSPDAVPAADDTPAEVAPAEVGTQMPASTAAERLQAVRADLGACSRCRLAETRTHLVFGVGDPGADLLFVGEAPGAEEDRRGEPFVGRAGQLLDRMLGALGLERGEVYIANVLKCRPPSNRDPGADEVATCGPFLWRQIDAIRPKVICALGAYAARKLLDVDGSLASLRGSPRRVRGWQVVATYHPAYLLRTPAAKRQAWQDLMLVRRLLDRDK